MVAEHTAAVVGQQRLAFVFENSVEDDPFVVERQHFEGQLASCLVLV